MEKRTSWEEAAAAEGTTDSERYLSRLARTAFLSLWSYTNLYTDEGRRSGKGDGKELCDLLVVFGNNVLLFSDKHCEFQSHSDVNVAWARWYKRAIQKSTRQLAGAEKFVRENPGRVFLDRACQVPLPIALPEPALARYFLIAVTRGSFGAGAKFWGGGSSGTLMLQNDIEGEEHLKEPFRVGFPLPGRRFVHVLDEMSVDVLLQELDTVPDFVAYLDCKEVFLGRKDVSVSAAGEEQLLARYMLTMRHGKHGLPVIPPGAASVALVEGDWEQYSTSPQRKAKQEADQASFIWDALIEYQSGFIRAGTATSLPGHVMNPEDHERIVRALADESRLSRRELSKHLHHALSQSESGNKFARVVMSGDRKHRAYVFLTAPVPHGVSYEEYREMRADALVAYCHGVKLKFPWVTESVGIASEPLSENIASQDFMYVDLGDSAVSPDDEARWKDSMAELDVLQSPTIRAIQTARHEFPIPFNFEQVPEFRDAGTGMPMNRAARRAMAKEARKKFQ